MGGDTLADIVSSISDSLATAIGNMVEWIPAIIAAVIVLLVGWFVGRFAGKIVRALIDKLGIGGALDKTPVGGALRSAGMTTASFFGALVKWFIYLAFIMAALNVLGIELLIDFMNRLVLYIPHLVAGLLLLVLGLILVDFVMDWVSAQLKSREVEQGELVSTIVRALLTFMVLVLALDQMLIDTSIIYTFLQPIAWGLAIGLGIAIGIAFGWGSKDVVAEYVKERWAQRSKET